MEVLSFRRLESLVLLGETLRMSQPKPSVQLLNKNQDQTWIPPDAYPPAPSYPILPT